MLNFSIGFSLPNLIFDTMRYKIFQATKDVNEPIAGHNYGKPVVQYRVIKLIELDFTGQNNDFTSMEDAEAFVTNNPNLRGYELLILPYIKT